MFRIVLLTFIFSFSAFGADKCYYSSFASEDLKISLTESKKNSYTKIKFQKEGKEVVMEFFCMKLVTVTKCVGDDDSGTIVLKNGKMEIKNIAVGNPDKEMIIIDSPTVLSSKHQLIECKI